MRLLWSVDSLADRESILEYIAAENPAAAIATDDAIASRVERLVQFPRSGRAGRVAGTRELVIPRTAFIAVYRLTATKIVILRVLHGARLWPPAP